MTKTILRGAVAAASLFALAGAAQAQVAAAQTPHNVGTPVSEALGNPAVATFTTSGSIPGNSDASSPSVQSVYTLTGNVTPDCSFFGQGDRTIQLGQLGVRTGNNEAVGNMFNLRQAATVNINSSAAGCNTANTVTIAKNTDRGLVNPATTSFDQAQFQNNLPYSVDAKYTAPNTGTQGQQTGNLQTISVASSGTSGQYATGAWRSAFNIDVTTDVPTKGLIAGTYEGTLTVTLAASVS